MPTIFDHLMKVLSIESEELRQKERWEVDHQRAQSARELETSLNRASAFHDMVVDSDVSFYAELTDRVTEERRQEGERLLAATFGMLGQLERQLLELCGRMESHGYKVKGREELAQKYEELIKNLQDEWNYDSPGFQKILRAAEPPLGHFPRAVRRPSSQCPEGGGQTIRSLHERSKPPEPASENP
ncbi:MAG: hypothetical protein AABZ64_11255 [Nitrospinota bacterium]